VLCVLCVLRVLCVLCCSTIVFSVSRRMSLDGPTAPSSAPAASPPSTTASETMSVETMLQWLHEVCLHLVEVPEPMMALRLLLCCAHVASEEAQLEMLAYEFFEKAFTLFEESIADSRQQIIALQVCRDLSFMCTLRVVVAC
jgi:Vacuolar protein sorting-associated protein 35